MAKPSPIYVGQKFIRLTIVSLGKHDGHGHRYHFCVCSCRPDAKPRQYREDFLRSGRVKSCGCLRAETQWNFGVKPRKRREKANGVGDSKPPEVPESNTDAPPTPVNVGRLETSARHKAVAQFNAGIAALVASGTLPATSAPHLSYQEVIALLTEDTGPKFTALLPCVQKLVLKIARPLWNEILRDQGLSPFAGAYVKPNDGNFTGIENRDSTGRLETGYTDAELISIAEQQDRDGRRVTPKGSGPDADEDNGETDDNDPERID